MMRVIRILILLFLLAASAVSLTGARAATPAAIEVLTAKSVVNPVMADYIKRGIEQAEINGATALIIQLDTPGGLDTSMRDIVQDIVSSSVPVVVYVSPQGARAASAGVFITVAAHVASMAPNTTIGAAHPVSIGQQGVQEIPADLEEKIVNDAAAYIRSLAGSRGRNIDWAERAVRQSVSATEKEALDLDVVDLIATDLNDLISRLDGRRVVLVDGAEVTLNTQEATVRHNPMTGVENFLNIISDPNIAYLLLGIATLGILTEILNPGMIFPGVIGAIALLMALFSLGSLPVNYAGIGLIIIAIGLFVAELLSPGIGLYTAGGLVAMVLGSLMLFKGGPLFRIDPWLIGTVTAVVAGFFAIVLAHVIKSRHIKVDTGWEELIGKPALVKVALSPEGMVLFRGERWKAVSEEGTVPAGEEVIIKRIENLSLYVTRKK